MQRICVCMYVSLSSHCLLISPQTHVIITLFQAEGECMSLPCALLFSSSCLFLPLVLPLPLFITPNFHSSSGKMTLVRDKTIAHTHTQHFQLYICWPSFSSVRSSVKLKYNYEQNWGNEDREWIQEEEFAKTSLINRSILFPWVSGVHLHKHPHMRANLSTSVNAWGHRRKVYGTVWGRRKSQFSSLWNNEKDLYSV